MKKNLIYTAIALIGLTSFSCSTPEGHSKFTKVTDYLFEVTYTDYEENYQAAQDYCTKYKPAIGGCSSVQNGLIRGRNYDWTYDEEPEFVVRVPAKPGRHASIGVAATTAITAADVESGKNQDFYKILPYFTLDGMNDAGVTVNLNVVNFGEKGTFKMRTPQTDDDVCPLLITRQLLDKTANLEEIISLLNTMDIFSLGTADECHLMITAPKSASDNTMTTVVIEFIPDENQLYQLNVIDNSKNQFVENKPIMTNFHLTGFDGSVASLTPHPMGYERYLILLNSYDQGKTVAGMKELMKKVYYTKAYDIWSDMYWYSDCAAGELTIKNIGAKALNGDISRAGVYADTIKNIMADFENTTRTSAKKRWHTVHTSVYDIENRTLSVMPQEAGFSYDYKLQ